MKVLRTLIATMAIACSAAVYGETAGIPVADKTTTTATAPPPAAHRVRRPQLPPLRLGNLPSRSASPIRFGDLPIGGPVGAAPRRSAIARATTPVSPRRQQAARRGAFDATTPKWSFDDSKSGALDFASLGESVNPETGASLMLGGVRSTSSDAAFFDRPNGGLITGAAEAGGFGSARLAPLPLRQTGSNTEWLATPTAVLESR